MKKRVMALVISLCLLFGLFTCFANAALTVSVEDIVSETRICPGKTINLEAPEVVGFPYSQGWEIQDDNGEWVPYGGETLKESDNGKQIRYFAANEAGDYAYSNTCTLIVRHNPTGPYQYDGMNHWRVCADCGGQADKGAHTTLGESATAADKVCTVCGQVRTSQYTGLLAFWEWLMNLLFSLIS